ncbi:MAG TPA: FAD-dependent monooxygenase [Xanthobacteraceae bacterium]|nr:FAD-dependent monooxygenase [Xanthobacteraceae bacterium]
MTEDRVLIAGAGPVGLTAAAQLVRRGIPVTVFEASKNLSEESRASTFHPPTLDMLDELGAARPLIAQGLTAAKFQYRSKRDGVIAEFDFGAIADVTAHPYRMQAEQYKLTHILLAALERAPEFRIEFSSRVEGVAQDSKGVAVRIARNGTTNEQRGRWLIGADGARSEVRRALGIEFEGFTWPERFLVVSTPFDFAAAIERLASVSYVADPQRWHFLLRIPGLWRVMFPIAPDVSDETALDRGFAQAALTSVVPGVDYEIAHTTLYRVHQRVAKTYRVDRVFLAGDAAHVNNPLGGMGMNGGIHDAVNLTERLAHVIEGAAPEAELDRYDRQRRQVALEYVQTQSIRNKRNLEAREDAERDRFRDEMRRTAADPQLARDYLLRVSMIASLKRAAELC